MVVVVPRCLHVANWSKWTSGVAKAEIGLKVCLCTLIHWHWRHEHAHLRVSTLMFGQTYCEVIRCCVAFTLGCERECNELKINCRNCGGTYGHGVPVDNHRVWLHQWLVSAIL